MLKHDVGIRHGISTNNLRIAKLRFKWKVGDILYIFRFDYLPNQDTNMTMKRDIGFGLKVITTCGRDVRPITHIFLQPKELGGLCVIAKPKLLSTIRIP